MHAPAQSTVKMSAAAAAPPPQDVPGAMLASPFFGISAHHFATLLAHQSPHAVACGVWRHQVWVTVTAMLIAVVCRDSATRIAPLQVIRTC